MRISYWSSDLCSSDLFGPGLALGEGEAMLNIAHGRYAQAAVQPPSTLRLAPVMFAASSRVRKAASAATCSTVTNCLVGWPRSEEHTSELQSLMRISYAVFCLKKKNNNRQYIKPHTLH